VGATKSWRKAAFSYGTLVLIGLSAFYAYETAWRNPGRDLSVQGPLGGIPAVIPGDQVHARFLITNSSRSWVRIDQFLPSCSCVTVPQESRVIGPLGAIEVTIQIDTTGMKSDSLLEVVCKSVETPDSLAVLTCPVVLDVRRRTESSSDVALPGIEAATRL
jgi:hypothetical protein